METGFRTPDTPIASLADVRKIEATPIDALGLPNSTYQLLGNSAARFGERLALRFLPTGALDETPVDFTYEALFARVTQAANAFHALGVDLDSSVSMLLPSVPQAHFTIWGAEAAGIFNPINPLLEVEHIAAIVREARSRVLVTMAPGSGDLWDKAQAVQAMVPELEYILTVNPSGTLDQHLGKGVLDFDLLLAEQNDQSLDSGRVFDSKDIASYFHTGGTTGVPKLAPHTHLNEVIASYQVLCALAVDETAVGLCGLPLFHVNGVFVTGLAPWMVGSQVIIGTPAGYRTPALIENFWGLVEKYKISYFSAVPTIISALLDLPSTGYDLSSLDVALCGAAPLPTEVIRKFEQRTGIVLVEGYGQTEGTVASTVNPKFGERKVGSVGLPLPWCKVRIVEVDTDGKLARDCAVDEPGEIAISGPNVFAGYKQPQQNEGQWVEEGWFNTGDLGRLDADGYLWLTGRSKDLIIRGGHNIDPQMIEDVYYRHEAVVEAVALGKPDKRVGELPVLVVQLREGASTSAEELLEFGAAHIHERAAVPKEIHFVAAMPVTAVGKIFKPDLRNDLIREQVTAELAGVLDSGFEVSVKMDKKHGQCVSVRTARENAAAVVEALGDYTFKLEILH